MEDRQAVQANRRFYGGPGRLKNDAGRFHDKHLPKPLRVVPVRCEPLTWAPPKKNSGAVTGARLKYFRERYSYLKWMVE